MGLKPHLQFVYLFTIKMADFLPYNSFSVSSMYLYGLHYHSNRILTSFNECDCPCLPPVKMHSAVVPILDVGIRPEGDEGLSIESRV